LPPPPRLRGGVTAHFSLRAQRGLDVCRVGSRSGRGASSVGIGLSRSGCPASPTSLPLSPLPRNILSRPRTRPPGLSLIIPIAAPGGKAVGARGLRYFATLHRRSLGAPRDSRTLGGGSTVEMAREVARRTLIHWGLDRHDNNLAVAVRGVAGFIRDMNGYGTGKWKCYFHTVLRRQPDRDGTRLSRK
jgi:hypothetical protein